MGMYLTMDESSIMNEKRRILMGVINLTPKGVLVFGG